MLESVLEYLNYLRELVLSWCCCTAPRHDQVQVTPIRTVTCRQCEQKLFEYDAHVVRDGKVEVYFCDQDCSIQWLERSDFRSAAYERVRTHTV